MQEYLQRVYSSILSHPDILALGDGIARLLVQQAQSVVLMHRAVENVQRRLTKTKEALRSHVEREHPVLSRIGPWMRDRMYEAEANFIEDCEWSAHEEAVALCGHQNLQQTVYFLNRDLIFMREVHIPYHIPYRRCWLFRCNTRRGSQCCWRSWERWSRQRGTSSGQRKFGFPGTGSCGAIFKDSPKLFQPFSAVCPHPSRPQERIQVSLFFSSSGKLCTQRRRGRVSICRWNVKMRNVRMGF